MNKTIIINMNGIIFHIEEDAYELLKNYMSSVKRHFAYTADSDEIVSDIESRIAEMFHELLAEEKKQVVVLKDVESVVAQMGSVSDFESAEKDHVTVETEPKSDKRLFRDTDDRIIGGVAAGIGHYFSIKPVWTRLFFVVLTAFFFTGVFAYLILWLAMPKAKSRGEKMAMKGERLNLQNFKRNFDEEIEAMQTNRVVNRAGGFFQALFFHLFNFLGKVGKVLLKLVCWLIIIFGLGAVVALFVTLLILMGNTNLESAEIFDGLNTVNAEYRTQIYFSAFVVFLVPLAALVLFAVRVLFNQQVISRTGAFAMLIIWLTGAGMGIFYVARVVAEFSEEASFSQTVPLKPSPNYVLTLNDARVFTHEDSVKYNLQEGVASNIGGRERHFNEPNIRIHIEEAAPGESPSIIKKFYARGKNFDEALVNARSITYSLVTRDSVIQFARKGRIPQSELWRNQFIDLTVRVPKGTRLRIASKLNWYVEGYNIDSCIPEGSYTESGSADWIMDSGRMKCAIDSLNDTPETSYRGDHESRTYARIRHSRNDADIELRMALNEARIRQRRAIVDARMDAIEERIRRRIDVVR